MRGSHPRREGLDLLYVRPGATLSAYSKVMIDPVEVAFSKDWKPSSMKVSNRDREKIRTGVAKGFHEVFTKELQEKGGYQVVDTAGPDVLRVTAGVIDLYIEAPDTGGAGNFIVNTGREIPPEVKVAQITALLEPVSETVALQEPGEHAADRQAVVAHRGKDEDLIEVEIFSQQPVQFYVGKNTTRQSEMPRRIPG